MGRGAKVKKTVAAATKGKKNVAITVKRKSNKSTYAAMVTKAIMELKKKKGSSCKSIMKYLQGNYKVKNQLSFFSLKYFYSQVNAVSFTLLMNKALKKMTTDGRLVAGAQAGESEAGCNKFSMEEMTPQLKKTAAKKMFSAKETTSQEVIMNQMFRTKMGATKEARVMCTNYARDAIEQLWLQWGVEKLMLSKEEEREKDNVECVRKKLEVLRTDESQ